MNGLLKMRFFCLKECSLFWLSRTDHEITNTPEEADYIIYESTGDPSEEIKGVKEVYHYRRKDLIFILSGDIDFSDNESWWFATTLVPNGVNKYQIYTTNPRLCSSVPSYSDKKILGYFGGTIWNSPSRQFLKTLSEEWLIEENNYWDLPYEEKNKVTQSSYTKMRHSYYTLCPKGNGFSSMRIAEALACGSVPILIDDYSNPFNENYGNIPVRLSLESLPDFETIIKSREVPSKSDFESCIDYYTSNINNTPRLEWSVCSGFSDKVLKVIEESPVI